MASMQPDLNELRRRYDLCASGARDLCDFGDAVFSSFPALLAAAAERDELRGQLRSANAALGAALRLCESASDRAIALRAERDELRERLAEMRRKEPNVRTLSEFIESVMANYSLAEKEHYREHFAARDAEHEAEKTAFREQLAAAEQQRDNLARECVRLEARAIEAEQLLGKAAVRIEKAKHEQRERVKVLEEAGRGMLAAFEYAGTRLVGAEYHAKKALRAALERSKP